jgi:putative SOS response-associated peptidase YedK
MCGRYGVTLSFSSLASLLRAEVPPDLTWGPDFNIAPTDLAPVLLPADGHRRLALYRWGLLPFWADDPRSAAKLINARCETVADKPAFRDAFARRRLLVPASGWYEWTHASPAKGRAKPPPTPHWIHAPDDAVLLLAGVGAAWRDRATGETRETFAILTTDASTSTREVHDRMPLVLAPELADLWLDPSTARPVVADLLQPYAGPLAHHVVSQAVNRVAAEGAELIRAVEDTPPLPRLPF